MLNIIIKLNDINNNKTYDFVIQKLSNETSAPINNVKYTKRGEVIVKCKNKEDVFSTKSMLSNKLGADYCVGQENTKLPRIKLIDVNNELNKDELLEDLANRNHLLLDGSFTIIAISLFADRRFAVIVGM